MKKLLFVMGVGGLVFGFMPMAWACQATKAPAKCASRGVTTPVKKAGTGCVKPTSCTPVRVSAPNRPACTGGTGVGPVCSGSKPSAIPPVKNKCTPTAPTVQPPSTPPAAAAAQVPTASGSSPATTSQTNRNKTKGNNGVGNGTDPQPPGNPPVNDGAGTSPGNPGNKGRAAKQK